MRRVSCFPQIASRALIGAFLGLATVVPGPGPVSAQGFDSPLVPAGRLRLQVLPSLHAFDTRFGLRSDMGRLIEAEEPLGFDFDRESLGSDVFPELEADEELLGAAVGDPDFRLNLGSVRVLWDAYSTRIPVRVDVGITDWLTVGATVPFERRRVDSDFLVLSTGANVGESPLVTDPGAPTAFLNEYRAALQEVTASVDALCADSGEASQGCQEARTFLNGANRTFEGLESAYSGSELFLLEGSPGAGALLERIQEVRSGMSELGVSSFGTDPPLATEPLGGADQEAFTSRFIAPIYGNTSLPLVGGQGFWELGDVELSAHLRLLSLTRGDTMPGGRPGLRLQLAAGGLVRLGTAARDTLRDFLDLDAQRGTNDVELHVLGDLDWPAARIGGRLQLIRGIQGSAEVRRRIGPPGDVLTAAPTGIVSWKPGSYTILSVSPRVFLTPELALGAVYDYYDRASASVSLLSLDREGDASSVDASVLERETGATLHEIGLRLVYSTIEATRGERTELPFELEAGWEKAVAGSGGRTPDGSRIHAGVRVYVRLWGGS